MKREILALGTFSVTLVVVLFLFMSRANSGIRLSKDTNAVRQEVLRVVPKNSDVKQAKPQMEKNGFTCTWSRNEEFATFTSKGRQINHPKANFLYCDKEQGFIIKERGQVAIVHKNGRVVDVFVAYGLIAP